MLNGLPGLVKYGIYLGCRIGGKDVSSLVDTGANISLIHAGVFFGISSEYRPKLKLQDGLCMILADGKNIPVHGKAEMEIEVGGKKMKHAFWVADLGPDCILGLDFLRQHDCIIYARSGQVKTEDDIGNVAKSRNARDKCRVDEFCCRQVTSEPEVLSVQSETSIAVRVNGLQETGEEAAKMINQLSSLSGKEDGLVARCVEAVGQEAVPVRLVNLSDNAGSVYRDATEGDCEEVEEVSSGYGAGDVTKDLHKGTGLFPGHLEKLYGTCRAESGDPQENEVKTFLHRWQDAFAKGARDLGRTQIGKRKTNTATHWLIHQSARKLPLNKQEKTLVTYGQASERLKITTDQHSSGGNSKATEETFEKGDLVLVQSPRAEKSPTKTFSR